MSVKFTDNSAQYLSEFDRVTKAALEAIGNQAVSHAKDNVTAAGRVATGTMRDSIDHKVVEDKCYIGTNVRYAIYNEMGTGIYIAGGRKTPWSYQDGKGNWHRTRGMAPIHFLKNAVANHMKEYAAIVQRFLKGG